MFISRKLNCIVLKKVGKIGGDDSRVKSRLRHLLSRINPEVDFTISEVRVRGSSSLPPIYEVVLTEAEAAEDLRSSFKRFTRKKNPVARPPELDGVEVFNSVTLATRVRISILRVSLLSFIRKCFLIVFSYLWLYRFIPIIVITVVFS